MISPLRSASFLAFLTVAPSLAFAQTPGRHVTDYAITLAGFTIATASFNTVLKETDYSVTGRFRTAGIAGLITTISGETSTEGQVSKGQLTSSEYRLVYRRGERSRIYDVKMRNGNVTSTTIEPPPRRSPETWVAVRDADLRRVVDPLSGLMIPSSGKVCPTTLPVYDGETRMDIVLTDKGTKTIAIGKRRIDALVCGARYVPKAGFKRGRKDIEFLKAAAMEIWFAKSDVVDLYAPVYARIPTKTGNLVITATRFGK